LVDGVGASVSAVFLGIMLPAFNERIGLSLPILFVLGGLALLFAVYSLTCFFTSAPYRPYLLLIIIANTLYSILTLTLVFFNSSLTVLGLLYFTFELIILVMLIYFEIRVLRKINF
jgi:hypothetical protein